MYNLEIDEERILDAINMITQSGQSASNYVELLKVGALYREWGLTPVYIGDENLTRIKIIIAETQDRSKLH